MFFMLYFGIWNRSDFCHSHNFLFWTSVSLLLQPSKAARMFTQVELCKTRQTSFQASYFRKWVININRFSYCLTATAVHTNAKAMYKYNSGLFKERSLSTNSTRDKISWQFWLHSSKSSSMAVCLNLCLQLSRRNQEYNSLYVSVLLSQNLLCIMILNVPTFNNNNKKINLGAGKVDSRFRFLSDDNSGLINLLKKMRIYLQRQVVRTKLVNKSNLIKTGIYAKG